LIPHFLPFGPSLFVLPIIPFNMQFPIIRQLNLCTSRWFPPFAFFFCWPVLPLQRFGRSSGPFFWDLSRPL